MKEREDLLSKELAAYAAPQLGAGVAVPLDGGEVVHAVLLQALAHRVQVVVRHHDLSHLVGCWPLLPRSQGRGGGGCVCASQACEGSHKHRSTAPFPSQVTQTPTKPTLTNLPENTSVSCRRTKLTISHTLSQ